MVEDVGERPAGDRHAQLSDRCEVRQALLAWRMFLREEHFLGRPLQGASLPDVTLQRAQHAIGEAAGVVVLELA